MREVKNEKRRRKKKSSGCCLGCLGKLIFFVIIFTFLGYFGYNTFVDLGLDVKLKQTNYPIKYQQSVSAYAEEFGLEEALVYAIIRTESRFDPYAVSNAGAKGLMQLTDETAQECAKALKVQNFSANRIFEPDINIRFGCYYLKRLIKKYNGKTENAVAAYNAGPGNVDKWLKKGALCDENLKPVNVPFSETRKYIENVFRAYNIYKEVYNLGGI